jgi:putative ABC transport system permease protein
MIVSEPFAYRTGMGVNDTLRFPTGRGSIGFSIAGVFYDYGSDQGVVMMRKDHFQSYFDTEGLSGISLYLEPGSDIGRVTRQVREASANQDLVIRSNRDLRDTSLEIFDRTFAITTVLQWLALAVAFVGVVAALMSLQIERKREFAVLRAEGLTPAQLWRYITLQTGVIGAGAGLLALPLGVLLAVVLVFVINKRSFGWTLELGVPADILLQGLALAIVASILAGIYPAWQVARTNPAEALRAD